MEKDTGEVDWEKVNEVDVLYISSIFDSLEWWKAQGARNFPEIFRVALPISALPASNAFLERIFSACTYFVDPLRQSLSPLRVKRLFSWLLTLI